MSTESWGPPSGACLTHQREAQGCCCLCGDRYLRLTFRVTVFFPLPPRALWFGVSCRLAQEGTLSPSEDKGSPSLRL